MLQGIHSSNSISLTHSIPDFKFLLYKEGIEFTYPLKLLLKWILACHTRSIPSLIILRNFRIIHEHNEALTI